MSLLESTVDPEIETLLDKRYPNFTDPELRKEIASLGSIAQVPVGTVMLDIDSYIRNIPLVVDGAIKIMREDEEGNELFLYYIDGGDTCAMSLTCCLSQQRSQIRAVVEEDLTAIILPWDSTDRWMQQYPEWKAFVMGTYSKRFEELLSTIDSIAFMRMDERLERFLHEKARTHGSSTINATHQEIAYELHSSREVISRLLKQLEKLGRIRLGRNRIELLK